MTLSAARTEAVCLKAAMATPLHAATFDAWRIVNGKTYTLIAGASADEDWRLATTVCQHKEQVWVREHMASGKTWLHVFAVREKREALRYCPETKQAVRIKPRFLDLVSSVEITAFSPVTQWVWTPGADVVGHDRSVVSQ